MSPPVSKFSSNLFKEITKNADLSENICMSPSSVATALSMVHVGARGNTAKQIKKVMHIKNGSAKKIYAILGSYLQSVNKNKDRHFTLKSANQMYVAEEYPLNQDFQNSIKQHFGAVPENVDFGDDQTQMQINKWVEEYTNHRIKNLITDKLNLKNIRLILVNALYFKGDWLNPFNELRTRVESFHLSHDERVDVKMMHINAKFRTGYMDALDARVLEMPYTKEKASMFIVLPNQINGLAKLESKMSKSFLKDIDRIKMRSAKLDVSIPKFKLEYDILKIKDALIQMGMTDLFSPPPIADLSGISDGNELYVSDVLQKTFIEVNETGTEAAASTVECSYLLGFSRDVPPPPFIADHPFIYLIRDNATKLTLFMGRLAKPDVVIKEALKTIFI